MMDRSLYVPLRCHDMSRTSHCIGDVKYESTSVKCEVCSHLVKSKHTWVSGISSTESLHTWLVHGHKGVGTYEKLGMPLDTRSTCRDSLQRCLGISMFRLVSLSGIE